jgi:hypothetical protein
MTLKNILASAACVTALTTGASAEDTQVSCVEPMMLAGMEVTDDGAIFNFMNGDEIVRVMLDSPLMPDGVLSLRDMVDEGLISNAMAEFVEYDLGAFLDAVEGDRSSLLNQFASVKLFRSAVSANVSFERDNAEGARMGFEVDLLQGNYEPSFSRQYGMGAWTSTQRIMSTLENVM